MTNVVLGLLVHWWM